MARTKSAPRSSNARKTMLTLTPSKTSTPKEAPSSRAVVASKSKSRSKSPAKRTPKSPSVRRKKPGYRALQEIRFYQRTWHLLLPKLSFARLVREIMQGFGSGDYKITGAALECLQTAAEAFVIRFFEDAQQCSVHAKRVTLMIQDMLLVRALLQNRPSSV